MGGGCGWAMILSARRQGAYQRIEGGTAAEPESEGARAVSMISLPLGLRWYNDQLVVRGRSGLPRHWIAVGLMVALVAGCSHQGGGGGSTLTAAAENARLMDSANAAYERGQ